MPKKWDFCPTCSAPSQAVQQAEAKQLARQIGEKRTRIEKQEERNLNDKNQILLIQLPLAVYGIKWPFSKGRGRR